MPDTLDIEDRDRLLTYLRETGRIGLSEEPRVQVLAGGVSNRTVLIERDSGEGWVLKQALQKLRTVADWYCDPARIEREALGLHKLLDLTPAGSTTPLVFQDSLHHLLAMQAVPKPHENWKTMLLTGRLVANHVRQFAELLASIHRKAAERRDELFPLFADTGYFESLRMEPYYQYTAGQVREAAGFLNALIADTRARRLTIVHGDYSPKNVLVHKDRLVLLDHEVIHWGDPAFDIGFALTHLLSKAHHLERYRNGFLTAAHDFWSIYRDGLGFSLTDSGLERMAVRHTLGCLLARVAGRSPLEYLSATQREVQQATCCRLMHHEPPTIESLLREFSRNLFH